MSQNLVYVAHPIDQVDKRNAWMLDQIKELEHDLKCCGFDQYHPALPWVAPFGAFTDATKQAISAVNTLALSYAGSVIALVPADQPSLGVPCEIEAGLRAAKPVVIVTQPGPMQSVQMHEWSRQGAHVTNSIRDGVSWLVSVFATMSIREVLESQEKATETPRTANGHKASKSGVVADDNLRFKMSVPAPSEYDFVPTRQYPGDAGFDLYVTKPVSIGPGEFADVECGCQVEMPEGWWGWITGRSSTLRKRGLLVAGGVIDNGYRGPLFVGVQNLSNHERVEVLTGERLAQFIPLPLFPGNRVVTPELSITARDHQGFGSSGQ